MDQINMRHKALIAKANASVAKARAKVEQDPLRPVYHLTTAAHWINDPNGPIFYKGEYHMFFQHNPYGAESANKSWGHAVSKDLVHWEHLPIALTPNPGSYDQDGVYSGCCVVHEGVPTIIYTGVRPEVQCIAVSHDGMRTWEKYSGNPVIPKRPGEDVAGASKLEGFRDPFAWKEDDAWYMVIGSGIEGEGGAALLYKSADLVHWEYVHPLCVGFGRMWECPNFFPIGDKHMLVVSPYGDVKYSIGTYKDHIFAPGPWHTMDMGGPEGFYAPNSLEDPSGRRIMWGWIRGGGTEGYPWNGVLTLPRVLTLLPEGRLAMEPLPELRNLRGRHYGCTDIALASEYSNVRTNVEGHRLEILVNVEPGTADAFGVVVGADTPHPVEIGYDRIGKRLFSGDRGGSFELLREEETLELHIFLDKSVIEVYANGRTCITTRYYPKQADLLGLNLFARGGTAKARSVDVWEMKSIWRS